MYSRRTTKSQSEKGMTLIELLGVIVIIGILFIVLNAAINSAQDRAKTSGVQTDFRSMQISVEHHVRTTNSVPTALQLSKSSDFSFGNSLDKLPSSVATKIQSLTYNALTNEFTVQENSSASTYISISDKPDPWGNSYVFIRETRTDTSDIVAIVSTGPDGLMNSNVGDASPGGDDIALVFYNN